MKSAKREFDYNEFHDPRTKYRGAFWAWNRKLNKDLLQKQLDFFKKMGFAGAVIHSRNGLADRYLGDKFFDSVHFALEYAEKIGLKIWIYDEDRWPSGSAGGIITADLGLRKKYLLITKQKRDGKLLACFDVTLDGDGFLTGYKKQRRDLMPSRFTL